MNNPPTYRPQGWRDLLPGEQAEYGDWFWSSLNQCYLPIMLKSESIDSNCTFIRKMKNVPLRGKW